MANDKPELTAAQKLFLQRNTMHWTEVSEHQLDQLRRVDTSPATREVVLDIAKRSKPKA
jgi:hypothetical protein